MESVESKFSEPETRVLERRFINTEELFGLSTKVEIGDDLFLINTTENHSNRGNYKTRIIRLVNDSIYGLVKEINVDAEPETIRTKHERICFGLRNVLDDVNFRI